MRNIPFPRPLTGSLSALAAFCSPLLAHADAELPSIIASNMVLQRERGAPIWGWDAPGTRVGIEFRGAKVEATAPEDGRWMGNIPTGAAGGPFPLRIQGTSSVELSGVLVGEVWGVGGQSNMWWHVSLSKNAEQEIQSANFPLVRVWDANTSPKQSGWPANSPQKTVQATWKVATPQTAGEFPAIPIFLARELHQKLGVPVGIVHVAVPGAEIEQFLSPAFLNANLSQTIEYRELRRRLFPENQARFEQAHKEWETQKQEAQKKGEKSPIEPKAPPNPDDFPPGGQFNGLIAPAAPFGARGFLWYQGEANTGRALQYRALFPALIQEWRELWGREEKPFGFVELANFGFHPTLPVHDDEWPALRDAQREALRLPGVFRVTAIDNLDEEGPVWNIHPKNKGMIAERLFAAAMANVYGAKTPWSGPVFREARFQNGAATVRFDHVGGGLIAKDGKPLEGFALVGNDRKWFPAQAKIQGDTLVLTNKDVGRPVAVRYNWAINPIGNLSNRDGWPAFPSRSDDWNLIVRP